MRFPGIFGGPLASLAWYQFIGNQLCVYIACSTAPLSLVSLIASLSTRKNTSLAWKDMNLDLQSAALLLALDKRTAHHHLSLTIASPAEDISTPLRPPPRDTHNSPIDIQFAVGEDFP